MRIVCGRYTTPYSEFSAAPRDAIQPSEIQHTMSGVALHPRLHHARTLGFSVEPRGADQQPEINHVILMVVRRPGIYHATTFGF